MKKKLLSFLLIVMLCCSAVYIFAGCKGGDMHELEDMKLKDESTVWTFKVDKSAGNKSNKEILLGSDAAQTEFEIPGMEGTIKLEEMYKSDAVAVSGLYITSVHSGTVTISYLGTYTCRVPYEVTE